MAWASKGGIMLLADRGYDADWIRGRRERRPAEDRPQQSDLLQPVFLRACNRVERFFKEIEQCRQIATRYDNLAAS